MTFDQLEALEFIVEKGSFKAAAEALHKTQPTLSISIKKLESEFDVLLFSREGYRPTLTPEGEVFYARAKQCLKSYRDLATVGKELGTIKIEPALTLSVDPLTPFLLLKPIFEECLNPALLTELTLRAEILTKGIELLLDQKADFAIGPLRRPHEDIESHAFASIILVPCIAASSEESRLRVPGWLDRSTQIIVRSFTATERKVEEESVGILEKGKKCYVSDHGLKKDLILQGFGWGRLARHELQAELTHGQIVELDDKELESIPIELHIMRHRYRPMGPVANAIWSKLLVRG